MYDSWVSYDLFCVNKMTTTTVLIDMLIVDKVLFKNYLSESIP